MPSQWIDLSSQGSGSKGAVYINAGWSYSLTGMYQVAPDRKWGFNVSAAITGREGYPIPYYVGRVGGFNQGSVNIQATVDSDDFQNDDVQIVDLRLEKEFTVGGDVNFTIGVEAFNIFNESTVLQREHRLSRGNTNWVREIVSPRVFRVGARFRFQ